VWSYNECAFDCLSAYSACFDSCQGCATCEGFCVCDSVFFDKIRRVPRGGALWDAECASVSLVSLSVSVSPHAHANAHANAHARSLSPLSNNKKTQAARRRAPTRSTTATPAARAARACSREHY
jgi:hypothetical protein